VIAAGEEHMLRRFADARPFWTFYLLALAFPTLLMVYMAGVEVWQQSVHGPQYSVLAEFSRVKAELIQNHPALFHHEDSWVLYVSCYALLPLGAPFFFFPAGPTVAAIVVVAWLYGRGSLGALLRLYLPVQGSLGAREAARIYAGLVAGLCLMVSLTIAREHLLGSSERAGHFLRHLGVIDWQVFLGTWIMALFFNQGGALEELGWRGFGLPLVIRRLGNPLLATLLLGFLWAMWHFPREVLALAQGQQTVAVLLPQQAAFIVLCCAMSVVATWFVNLTGGSVLPAIMIHGTLNLTGGMFEAGRIGIRSEMGWEAPMMWMAAAAVVLLLAGTDLGWKRRLELHGGRDPSDAWTRNPARL
jgi:hypothetical protein